MRQVFSDRAASIVVVVVLALSSFGLFSAFADAGELTAPEDLRPDADRGMPPTATPSSGMRATPMTRAEVIAFAEKRGPPRAGIEPLDERRSASGDAVRGPALITPEDLNETMIHKADQAHALGFDGAGVRVAVIDTGVDFAHPDLINASARVTNPASPYYLHPIAYDGSSMNDYLAFGKPSPTLPDGSNAPFNSWYVNTSYSTTVVESGGTRWVNWTSGTATRSWTVTAVSGLSAGEEVRVGFHPDDALLAIFDIRPGLILYNHAGAGAPYDSVIVDLDTDGSMNDEKRAFINTGWATFDPKAELIFQDIVGGDGVPDISGGMVYFIADGVREIPYASHQIDAMVFYYQTLENNNSFNIWDEMGMNPAAHLVPDVGDLVLLFGDFNGPGANGAHGTWVTSAIAGQGLTGGGSIGPVLKGQAPGAKIIGAGNNFGGTDPFGQAAIYAALIFATEGYDGIVGGSDAAHIASNSWGGADWTGWDWSSRFADYVSAVYASGSTLFAFSAGNSGPGYGGLQGPAGGASLLVSGAMENYNYRDDPWYAFDGGPNADSSWGDTTYFSNRGPTAMGRHYVDALTSGQFGYGADPLNDNPFIEDSGMTLNGSRSWVLWAGTSLSTPNLAGVTALIYDAYMDAHGGVPPLASAAKTIVKNSADDAHQDPLLQGAGIANALRGVRIANEKDGLSLSVDEWNPGDYGGTPYPAYPNLLSPGDSTMVTVTATNHRPTTSMGVTIEDTVLVHMGTLSHSFNRVPQSAPNQWLLNGSGLLTTAGTVVAADAMNRFATADVARVTMFFGRARLVEAPQYLLRVFDWTDVNANGRSEGFGERNLMVQDWISFATPDGTVFHGPNGFVQVFDPAARSHHGLLIFLEPRLEAFLLGPVAMKLQIDYYERRDFSWLSRSTGALTIGAASSATVGLTVTVPTDARPGLYEAAVLFTLDSGNVTTLPVVVNVAASLPVVFGGNRYDNGTYQQGVTHGAAWLGDSASGDYRYYFVDLLTDASVTINVQWESTESSNDLFALSHTSDWFSDNAPARYGPGTQEEVSSTGAGSNTTSLIAEMSAGLGIIVVRGTFLAGIQAVEQPRGESGTFFIGPRPWVGVGVPVDGTQAFVVDSELAYPDVGVTVETGEVLFFPNQPVDPFPFGDQDPFEQYLFEAPNRLRTSIPIATLRATYTLFFHSGATDVDMGIFYDANCDGVYTLANDAIGTVASTAANPEIATILRPPAGCYWVHAAGFTVAPGSRYDLTVEVITQPIASAAILPNKIDASVPALVTLDYSLPHFPKTYGGVVYLGSSRFPRAMNIPVSLTPNLPPLLSNAKPAPGSTASDATPTISLDWRDAPDAFKTQVYPATVSVWIDGVLMSDPNIVRANTTGVVAQVPSRLVDGTHTVTVRVADTGFSFNATSWSFSVDATVPPLTITSPTVPFTNRTSVTVAGTTDPGVTLTIDGNPFPVNASGGFSTQLTLAEGAHSLAVAATDAGGNRATTTINITVDTTPPPLSLTAPASGSTVNVASVRVNGSTERGATLMVNGIQVAVANDGSFSVLLALMVGSNTITAVATDAAGNRNSATATVSFVDPVPGIRQDQQDTEQALQIARDSLAALQLLVYVLIGLLAVVAAIAVVSFLMYLRARKTAGPPGPIDELRPPPGPDDL